MKHLLQSVAMMVMAFLAIPPAVAEGLCLLPQSPPSNMECCTSLKHASAQGPALSIAQFCNEGCCSVTPQKSATLISSEKLKADSPTPETPQTIAVARLHGSPDLARRTASVTGTMLDLQILLQTFRI